MADWEWNPSKSVSIDVNISQLMTDADGTCEPDIVYIPTQSKKTTVTIAAKYLTDIEAASELAKLGTSQTFTDHRGNTITGIVAGYSDSPTNSTGRVNVTLTLVIPWIS